MTEEEKQRGLELQSYIDSIRDMTIKEIAIKHLKKHHLPKFLAGLLVKFSAPLLMAKDYELTELEEELKKWKDEWQEQVQKENDESYARTLQTIQLSKAKEIIKNLVEFDSSYKDDEEYQRKSELYDKMWEEAEQFLKDSEVEK